MGVSGILKFFGRRILELIIISGIILIIPNLPPHLNYSNSYNVLVPELKGKYAPNEKLKDVEIWHKGDFIGPEAFADYNGELYTSLFGGDVVKFVGNEVKHIAKIGKPCKGELDEAVCGRPLGLSFDPKGSLYVADAYNGIFKIDVKTGEKQKWISLDREIGGKKPKFPNSVTAASNGDLFWTETSSEFSQPDALYEMLSDGTGRLIHYIEKTGQNKELIKNLIAANGVALSKDEDFVIVAESGRNRVLRYYLKGPKQGHHDIFVDQLPGIPDNIKPDGQDGFLIAIVAPVDVDHPNIVQSLGQYPLLRKFISRIMALLQLCFRYLDSFYPNDFSKRAVHNIGNFKCVYAVLPSAKRVTIVRVSKTGEVLETISTTSGKITGIGEAHILGDQLYLGTPFNDYIGRIPLSKIGWSHLGSKQGKEKTARSK